MMYIKWLVFLPFVIALNLLAYIINPIVAIWTVKRDRKDYVKRLQREITMPREYLIDSLYLMQTHDNAVDEYWYGMYNEKSFFPYLRNMTQARYDNSWFARYIMRVMWLYRNTAYGLIYKLFSARERNEFNEFTLLDNGKQVAYLRIYKGSFQCKGVMRLFTLGKYTIYNDFNIGWKEQSGFKRCMYAGRLIGLRVR